MLEKLLSQLESEALRISAGKGSWERYNELQKLADAELANLIDAYETKNFS